MARRAIEEQEALEAEVYQNSLSGKPIAQIAHDMGITERSVYRALHSARKAIRESRARKGQHRDLATYTARKDAVIEECWRRVDTLPTDSRTAAELLETVSTALDGIGKAQGLFVDQHKHDVGENLATLMQALTTRHTVVVPEPPDVADFE